MGGGETDEHIISRSSFCLSESLHNVKKRPSEYFKQNIKYPGSQTHSWAWRNEEIKAESNGVSAKGVLCRRGAADTVSKIGVKWFSVANVQIRKCLEKIGNNY